jgi:hypothetical protein
MIQEIRAQDQLGKVFARIGCRGRHHQVEHPGLRAEPAREPRQELRAHGGPWIGAREMFEDLLLVQVRGDQVVLAERDDRVGSARGCREDPNGSIGWGKPPQDSVLKKRRQRMTRCHGRTVPASRTPGD